MPVLDDDTFELPTIMYNGNIYVKIDDIIAWIKDCQANGMDKEATHWILSSLISCKMALSQVMINYNINFMSKKKTGKHLKFYIDCINNNYVMPQFGLCSCAWADYIDEAILLQFKPDHASNFDYWAGKGSTYKAQDKFTPLRQTIVLFMAAINNEL